ncbi:MAG: hypothetical protein ACRBG0_04620 [Lewinella sp.]|jgi:hypothetical protein|uniref:hypothetical protein n=1 Tax=Lewinella sp. TaxID=2004506 RepID=UPI003D6BFE6C
MKNTPVDFRPLLLMLNLALAACIVCFIYLLAGDQISSMFAPAPPIIERQATARASTLLSPEDEIVNGIHVPTGLIYDEGFELVRATCTACHSAKLVTQNKATKEGWTQMIRWMQETQGLWDLGANETPIISYLARNYAPEEIGRRANLEVAAIEWYILELD